MSLFTLPRARYAQPSLSYLRTVTPSLALSHKRVIHTTRAPSSDEGMNNIRQGHATNPKNLHPQDVGSQSVAAGFQAREDEKSEGVDVAKKATRGGKDKKPRDVGKGNPEGVGFVEQVGSASSTARKFEEEQKK